MSDYSSSMMDDIHSVYDCYGRLRQVKAPSRIFASEKGSISWMDSTSALGGHERSYGSSSHGHSGYSDTTLQSGSRASRNSSFRQSPRVDGYRSGSSRNSYSSTSSTSSSSSSTAERSIGRSEYGRSRFSESPTSMSQGSPTLQITAGGHQRSQSPPDATMAIRARYPKLRSPRGSVHRLSARSIANLKSIMEGTVAKPRAISPRYQTLGPVVVSVQKEDEEEEEEEEEEHEIMRHVEVAKEYFIGEEVYTPSGQKAIPSTAGILSSPKAIEKRRKSVRLSTSISPGSVSPGLEETMIVKPGGQKRAIRFSDSPVYGVSKGSLDSYPQSHPSIKQREKYAPEPTPLVYRPVPRSTSRTVNFEQQQPAPAPAPLSLRIPHAPLVPKIKVSRFVEDDRDSDLDMDMDMEMEMVGMETCIPGGGVGGISKSVRIFAREVAIDRETRKYRKTPTPVPASGNHSSPLKGQYSCMSPPWDGKKFIPRPAADNNYLCIPSAHNYAIGTPPAAPNPPRSKKSTRRNVSPPPRPPPPQKPHGVRFFVGGPISIPSRPVSPGAVSVSSNSSEESVPIDSRFLRYRSPRPGMRRARNSPKPSFSGSSGHGEDEDEDEDEDEESLYEFGTGSSTPVASVGTSACPIEINRRRFLRDMEKRVQVHVGRAKRVNHHNRRTSDTPGPLCTSSSATSSTSSLSSYETESDCYTPDGDLYEPHCTPWTMQDLVDVSSTTEIRTTAALLVKNDIAPKPNYLAPFLGDWNRKSSTDTQLRVLFQEEMRRWSDDDVYNGMMGDGEDDAHGWVASPAPLAVGWDRPRL